MLQHVAVGLIVTWAGWITAMRLLPRPFDADGVIHVERNIEAAFFCLQADELTANLQARSVVDFDQVVEEIRVRSGVQNLIGMGPKEVTRPPSRCRELRGRLRKLAVESKAQKLTLDGRALLGRTIFPLLFEGIADSD